MAVLEQRRLLAGAFLFALAKVRKGALEGLLGHAFAGKRLAGVGEARVLGQKVLDGESGPR